MRFKKDDLIFSYQWTPVDTSRRRSVNEPDEVVFNPAEGEEILYIINRFIDQHGLKMPVQARNLERLLKYSFPTGTYSRRWALKWLAAHYRV